MAIKFVYDNLSRFRDIDSHNKVERGDWTPDYWAYEWVDGTQYLLVSDQTNIKFKGKLVPLSPVIPGINYKGLENLKEPGTYYLVHKKSWGREAA